MRIEHLGEGIRRHWTGEALSLMNVALMPLYANLIAVTCSGWEFGRSHIFPLSGVIIVPVVALIRWRLPVGIVVNAVVAVVALVMLFWSAEPLVYLSYTGGLVMACAVVLGLIYVWTRRRMSRME